MSSDLIEFMPFEYQIVESGSGGKFCVEGVFQRSDVENANKRVYPKRIWEKTLGDGSIQESLSSRRMFGELDHPSDGKTSLKRVSHVITNLSLQEDGTVIGTAEILNTPNGQILKSLFESNVQVGISSRGSGSVNSSGVVAEDFRLKTFDFVASPSTPGAIPVPTTGRKVTKEDLDDDFHTALEDTEIELDQSVLDSIIKELESFDAFSTGDSVNEDIFSLLKDAKLLCENVKNSQLTYEEVAQELVECRHRLFDFINHLNLGILSVK
jgi:hypothetical protein